VEWAVQNAEATGVALPHGSRGSPLNSVIAIRGVELSSRHRRAAFTIWLGHLPEEYQDTAKNGSPETTMNLFYQERKKMLTAWKSERNSTLRGCAIALEVGTINEGTHIQGYIELKSARSWQFYAKRFRTKSSCFEVVRSGIGIYEYVTKSGSHSDKEGVLENWSTGPKEDFRLYDGSSESKADLKHCVGLLVEGYHPLYILKQNPYAYTVHRTRIWSLWLDLQELENTGTLSGPPVPEQR